MHRQPVTDRTSFFYGKTPQDKSTKDKDQSCDEGTAPLPIGLWDRCEHIRSLIRDLHNDMETTSDKDIKDLATELDIDMPTNERHKLLDRVRVSLQRYLSEPLGSSPTSSRSDSLVGEPTEAKHEPLINFRSDKILLTKENFIQFVIRAGNEKYPKKGYPGPNKEVMKQINQLFNEQYYRKEDEYIISNPLKLEWHFSQEFIILAAIKYQYHIIWDTKDGLTDTMIHWEMPVTVTPQLRKESVLVVLYRHLKRLQHELTAYELCPPIYARLRREGSSAISWQKTVYCPDKKDFYTKAAAFPDWITDDDLEVKLVRKTRNKKVGIETFFFKASLDTFELGEHLRATNVVYYFLIHDKEIADFQEKVRPIEELHPTQAYVGRAGSGILDRWIKRTNSHCQIAARLCYHLQVKGQSPGHFIPGGEHYSASLLETYLALAKVLRYKCALFVLYDLNTEPEMMSMERDLINHHNTTNMHRGLNEVLMPDLNVSTSNLK